MKQDVKEKKARYEVPQIRVRTGMIAGQSVENCIDNLNYWKGTLESKCAKQGRLPSGYTG